MVPIGEGSLPTADDRGAPGTPHAMQGGILRPSGVPSSWPVPDGSCPFLE